MKRILTCLVLCVSISVVHAQSIDPVSLLIAKVIKAIDLKVQKLQNQTISLQQAQLVAEHQLSKLKLGEIADWQQKQQQLYTGYFKELQTVRKAVREMPQVKQILAMQSELLETYNQVARDGMEHNAMDALLALSKDVLTSLQDVINGNGLVMNDAERIKQVSALRDAMQDCLDNIKGLDKENKRFAATRKQLQSDMKSLHQLKQ